MSSEPLVAISGAIAGIVAAAFGYMGTVRGKRVTESAMVMEQMRAWATQVQESERKCRADMGELREELEEVRDELNKVKQKLQSLGDNSE